VDSEADFRYDNQVACLVCIGNSLLASAKDLEGSDLRSSSCMTLACLTKDGTSPTCEYL